MSKFTNRIPTTTIVLTLIGFFMLAWGIYQNYLGNMHSCVTDAVVVENGVLSEENEDKYVIVTAEPYRKTAPRDPLTGVSADGFVLKRTVDMYQYVIDADEVFKQFSDKQEENIKGKGGESYKNPVYPEDIRNAVFVADVYAGEFQLSPDFTATFAEDYEHFTDEHTMKRPAEYPAFDNDHGLVPVAAGYYDTGSKEERKVGDIRVSYTYIPTESFGVMTFFGVQKDGMICPDAYGIGAIYDRIVSKEEIQEEFEHGFSSASPALYTLAGILFASAAALLIISVRKNSIKKGEKK